MNISHTIIHFMCCVIISCISWMLYNVESKLDKSRQNQEIIVATNEKLVKESLEREEQLRKYITFKDQVFGVFCKHKIGELVETKKGVGSVRARMVQPVMTMYDIQHLDGSIERVYDTDIMGRISE